MMDSVTCVSIRIRFLEARSAQARFSPITLGASFACLFSVAVIVRKFGDLYSTNSTFLQ